MKAAVLPSHALAQAYAAVRASSCALAAPLSAEDCAIQSMPDASPVKWHLAHTSWFFETVILARRPGYKPFDPRFAYLFNSYYEALGPRHPRPRRGLLTRPGLDEVMAYRAHVDARDAGGLRRRTRCARSHRPGPASRAAASGTDPHRHQACFLLQSAAARLSRGTAPAPHAAADAGMARASAAALSAIGHDGPKRSAFDNESAAPQSAAAARSASPRAR